MLLSFKTLVTYKKIVDNCVYYEVAFAGHKSNVRY